MALERALLEILSSMLSESSEVRNLAEERRKALEVTDDYSVHLIQIILKREEATEERVLAAVLLNHYVGNYWNPKNHQIAFISDLIKKKILNELPIVLAIPDTKIQKIVAGTVATIAYRDQQCWPRIAIFISEKLTSSNFIELHGFLVVLDEIYNITGGSKLLKYPPQIYENLYFVSEHEVYTIKLRCMALKIFTDLVVTCSGSESTDTRMGITYKALHLLTNILPKPYNIQNTFELKSRVVECLNSLIRKQAPLIYTILPSIILSVWDVMIKVSVEYIRMLNGVAVQFADADEIDDRLIFYRLITNIILFVRIIISKPGSKYLLGEDQLTSLLQCMIVFLCITPKTEERWAHDVDLYFNPDSDSAPDATLRYTAKELYCLIVAMSEKNVYLIALSSAIYKVSTSCVPFTEYWWRIQESVMYCLGLANKELKNALRTQKHNNYRDILSNCFNYIESCPNFIYLSRTLWVAGRFSTYLNSAQIEKHYAECLNAIKSNHVILQSSGLKALYYHVRDLSLSKAFPEYDKVLGNTFETLYFHIRSIENNILHVFIKIFIHILKQRPTYAAFVIDGHVALITLLMEIYPRACSNKKVSYQLAILLKDVCVNPVASNDIKNRFLPNILGFISRNGNYITSNVDFINLSLELLNIIITSSPLPLSGDIIKPGFIAACKCMLASDDSDINKSAADVLCSYLTVAPNEVRFEVDYEECSFSTRILEVIQFSLCPQDFEVVSFKIGQLCALAMDVFDEVLVHNMDTIIRNMLSRMQRIQRTTLEDATQIIFSYFLLKHTNTVINLLLIIPGPNGNSALSYVFEKFFEENGGCILLFERNMNVMGLCAFMEYAIVNKDTRLTDCYIDDNGENGGRIPILYGAFRFVLNTLNNLECNSTNEYFEDEEESSDDDVSIDFFTSDSSDDHPVAKVNIKDFILNFLRNFCKTDYFKNMMSLLTFGQKLNLLSAGIPVSD